jgi:hypothetical protein
VIGTIIDVVVMMGRQWYDKHDGGKSGYLLTVHTLKRIYIRGYGVRAVRFPHFPFF